MKRKASLFLWDAFHAFFYQLFCLLRRINQSRNDQFVVNYFQLDSRFQIVAVLWVHDEPVVAVVGDVVRLELQRLVPANLQKVPVVGRVLSVAVQCQAHVVAEVAQVHVGGMVPVGFLINKINTFLVQLDLHMNLYHDTPNIWKKHSS